MAVIPETKEPRCNKCKRPTKIFRSEGLDHDSTPFITPYTFNCRHCLETEQLRGMMYLLQALIDIREET